MSIAKHWCFTLNNYSQQDEDNLQSAADFDRVSYLIYGKEVGESGTPHLQGFILLSSKSRLQWLNKHIAAAHWTVARSIRHSIEYCKKEGSSREFGVPPYISSKQGFRVDLDDFKAAVKGGMVDHAELREAHSGVMARYPRFCLSYVRDHSELPSVESHFLNGW